MILGDCQADFGINLKPSIFIIEDNVRGFEGVLEREENLTMVKTFMEICTFGPLNGEMPGIYVIF